MMSSHVILMSVSVFACGYPKKSFGYLILLYSHCCVRSTEDAIVLFIQEFAHFLLLGSRFPSSSWRGSIPALIIELFITNLYKYFWFFLIAAIDLVSLRFISVCIEILKLFSISMIIIIIIIIIIKRGRQYKAEE